MVNKLPDYLKNFNKNELEDLVYEKVRNELYPHKQYRKKRSRLKRSSANKNNYNNGKPPDILKDMVSELLIGKSPELEMLADFIGTQIKNILPDAVREGHIRALAAKPVSKQRIERYNLFHWFVCVSKNPLILGDVGCLFETSGIKKFKSIDYKNDGTKNIFLPISTEKMLIGTSLSILPQVDFKAINEAIAKCSREFFICYISSEFSPDVAYLHSLIGEEPEIISQEELEQIYRESIEQE